MQMLSQTQEKRKPGVNGSSPGADAIERTFSYFFISTPFCACGTKFLGTTDKKTATTRMRMVFDYVTCFICVPSPLQIVLREACIEVQTDLSPTSKAHVLQKSVKIHWKIVLTKLLSF